MTVPGDPPVEAGPVETQCRVAFGIAYDGAPYHGFAIQPNARTVAGTLLNVLEQVVDAPLKYTCAGRTDAGVHAWAQVLHVDLDREVLRRRFGVDGGRVGEEIPQLVRSLNRRLLPTIAVWKAVVVSDTFDARRRALARRYRYDLRVGARVDPLSVGSSWWVGPGLDLAAMRLGCDPLLGSHDFTGFCRRPPDHSGPLIRRVTEATWSVIGDETWRFEIEATSFCHQMVRSIVGSLVAVGRGKLRVSDIMSRLTQPDRSGAPSPAPPTGLCLIAVTYPEEFGGVWQ